MGVFVVECISCGAVVQACGRLEVLRTNRGTVIQALRQLLHTYQVSPVHSPNQGTNKPCYNPGEESCACSGEP